MSHESSVLLVCRLWASVGVPLFKVNFLSKMLSNKWEGRCSLETNNLQPLSGNIAHQIMEAQLCFTEDFRITGEGKNQSYALDSWRVQGNFDPVTTTAIWTKQFYGPGSYDGRVVRYTGQVILKKIKEEEDRCAAIIEGEICVVQKQTKVPSPDVVGDKGKFRIVSCTYHTNIKGDLWKIT